MLGCCYRYRKIFALDEVANNRNVLVGWLSGQEARHAETLSDAQVIDTMSQLIRQFLNDPAIPRPVRVAR